MDELDLLRKAKELETRRWTAKETIEPLTIEMAAILREVLSQNSANPCALTSLGALYADMGQYKEALELLQKAESMGFKDYNLYYNIAVALVNIRQEAAAKSYFSKAKTAEENELQLEHILTLRHINPGKNKETT